MSLKIGIVGLPNVGKSTLFNALLTRKIADTSPYPFCTIEPNVGVVEVPDDKLEEIRQAEKSPQAFPAVIEFVDIAGLVENAHQGEGLGNQFLAHIREVNALAHVIRVFEAPDVTPTGTTEPYEDYRIVTVELILADLETLQKQRKPHASADKLDKERWAAIVKARRFLNREQPLFTADLTPEERHLLRPLNLITLKPQLIVINADENQLAQSEEFRKMFRQRDVVVICARLEEELSELEPPDQQEYLKTLGLPQAGLERFIQAAFKMLGLITFYTVNENEARARLIKKGSTAIEAAGLVHSDIQEGFIRAAVCPFSTFIDLGGWKNALAEGKVAFKGRDYLVQPGEVIQFRFSD